MKFIKDNINNYFKINSNPKHMRRDQNYFEITKIMFKLLIEIADIISAIISIVTFITDLIQ